ncbi:LysE family translocator [Halocatena salina]|uniref:LysE family translocator n=1 Tax=Halocatena salina TaxID=2934340 RepID=A0A8U0A721_9EURY|nr:LysE family translocator [Halocatena salina]UPM43773.1 LysE family translocator [Halocatena salina]
MTEVVTFGAGVVFGIALAAPPGPMNAVIAEESVAHGWRSGVRAGVGAMMADICFFVGALLGVVTVVERLPTLRAAMVAVGGVLMLYFAYDTATDLQSGFRTANAAGADRGFRRAFVLAITNPYQILFWLTAGVALLDPGTVDVLAPLSTALAGQFVVQTGTPVLLLGLFSGVALWIVGFPAMLIAARKRMDSFAPLTAAASALVLFGFGVYFLIDAVTLLMD